MPIPDCYEADRQYARMDLAYTVRIMRRPRCQCCDQPITTENYLDLSPFGINAYACEACVNKHSYDTGDLDND